MVTHCQPPSPQGQMDSFRFQVHHLAAIFVPSIGLEVIGHAEVLPEVTCQALRDSQQSLYRCLS